MAPQKLTVSFYLASKTNLRLSACCLSSNRWSCVALLKYFAKSSTLVLSSRSYETLFHMVICMF